MSCRKRQRASLRIEGLNSSVAGQYGGSRSYQCDQVRLSRYQMSSTPAIPRTMPPTDSASGEKLLSAAFVNLRKLEVLLGGGPCQSFRRSMRVEPRQQERGKEPTEDRANQKIG